MTLGGWREGSGRKPIDPALKKTPGGMTIRLRPDMWEWLEGQAEQLDVQRATALKAYKKAKADGVDMSDIERPSSYKVSVNQVIEMLVADKQEEFRLHGLERENG